MSSGTTKINSIKEQINKRKKLPHLTTNHQLKNLMAKSKELPEIALITSYPPRECGIATYSKDLVEALNKKFGDVFKLTLYPLEAETSKNPYPKEIGMTINTKLPVDFLQAAYTINANPNIGLVVIQHEFGLFNQNEQSFYQFLEFMDKPVLLTFHTVLPGPSPELKEKVVTIASHCQYLIVMTHTSADILKQDYGISPKKIKVIPHGTHLIAYGDKDSLKTKYGLRDKTVLSTFGLLGPGKSIETTLDALPGIIKYRPNIIFLIIGRTHPNILKEHGEVYRDFLKQKIKALSLENHVQFVDRFVPLESLLEYLQLTDIYLFTSKDPNQAVSGTFAYALSCGCPVISTPIPHAVEVLRNGSGITFNFENSEDLTEKVIDLLDDEETRITMSMNGMHTASASAWENSAIAHAKIFEKANGGSFSLSYKKPPLNIKHLKRMTTNVGVIQFSKINHPDIESGYTLDDNARALIAICQHYKITRKKTDLDYLKIYFNFIFCCFRHDGKFLNYVDKHYQFTDQNAKVNLEDACGRAIWSLGYLLSTTSILPKEYDQLLSKAKFVFEHSIKVIDEVSSPRAMAFIIKGLFYYNNLEDRICFNKTIEKLADKLTWQFKLESNKDWHWYEAYLTYGNSVIPESMLMAYILTINPEYRKVAKASFDFLLSKIYNDGMISVISNDKWLRRGQYLENSFRGGEQPIEIAYTILTLRLFHNIFPFEGYNYMMEDAFAWFLGKNYLEQTLYNPCTGGCHDGLELHNVNLNQGAESTISYLLARMAFDNIET